MEAFLNPLNYQSYEEYLYYLGIHGNYVCEYCGTIYRYKYIEKLKGGECCESCGALFEKFKWVTVEE
jgi:hypothetical protein